MFGSSAGGAQVISSDADLTDPVLTDEDGRYSLRGVAGGVELIVAAKSDGDGSVESKPMVVDAGTLTQGVDLRFLKTGTVTVLLEGGADGAMVMGRPPGGATPQLEQLVDGRAVFSGLAPGKHQFRLMGLILTERRPATAPAPMRARAHRLPRRLVGGRPPRRRGHPPAEELHP